MAFNNCRNQTLKMMASEEPLRLFFDPKVKTVAIHKAAIIPVHLKEAMKADLNRDVRLEILIKVNVNLTVKWLSRMIGIFKKDGTHRRIIDYRRLNDAIPHQTNITQSAFKCASACPPNKKKTLLDAKDGYHSVRIKDLDQGYTEFLCEFGRYWCVGSGQGLICSGDAYTARFDKITQEFTNVVRCVDDSLIWADNASEMFDATCRYISVCKGWD